MPRSVSLVQLVRISTPCPLTARDWRRDERAWHCGVCDLQVHNLSAMSAADADTLLREHHGRLCARYVVDHAGAPIIGDRAWALRTASWRRRLHAIAAALGLAAFLGSRLGGCVPLGGVVQMGRIQAPDREPTPPATDADSAEATPESAHPL